MTRNFYVGDEYWRNEDLRPGANEIAKKIAKNSSTSRYLTGFNRKENTVIAQAKTDQQGYVFFTKPFLNLMPDNIASETQLHWLGDTNVDSLSSAVRCSLMPDPNMFNVMSRDTGRGIGRIPVVRSKLVDDNCPFIPILTTSLKNLTGWPDRVLEFFQSSEGIAKEIHGYVDSHADMLGTYDLTATFDARDGDIVNGLIQTLILYSALVSEGSILPFPYFLTAREIDYSMRIYSVKMDPTGKYVRKIACTGASMMQSDTSGGDFNYTEETNINMDNNEISVPFKCFGAWYNDPKVVQQFNNTTFMFNPGLENEETREQEFVKLDQNEILDHTVGYPIIGDDMELQWWVPASVYTALFTYESEGA